MNSLYCPLNLLCPQECHVFIFENFGFLFNFPSLFPPTFLFKKRWVGKLGEEKAERLGEEKQQIKVLIKATQPPHNFQLLLKTQKIGQCEKKHPFHEGQNYFALLFPLLLPGTGKPPNPVWEEASRTFWPYTHGAAQANQPRALCTCPWVFLIIWESSRAPLPKLAGWDKCWSQDGALDMGEAVLHIWGRMRVWAGTCSTGRNGCDRKPVILSSCSLLGFKPMFVPPPYLWHRT